MTYVDENSFKFPCTFMIDWRQLPSRGGVVQDTTDELTLPEHDSWQVKVLGRSAWGGKLF